jgi:integrase
MKVKNKRELTDPFVRDVKPKATTFLVWDTKQRRLALRVYPSGRKSFYFVYTRGLPQWYLISDDAVGLGIEQAKRIAAKLTLDLAEGVDPVTDRKAQLGGDTLAELHARYVEDYARQKNRSWEQSAKLIQRLVLPRLGRMDPKKLTRAHLKEVLGKIKLTKPILFNQALAAMSMFLKWAVAEDVIEDNIAKGIFRNPTRKRERKLLDSEICRFWPHMPLVLKVQLLLGQRGGEVACMRREHIKDGWWELPGEPDPKLCWPGTKNKLTHLVWLPKVVQEMIGTGETGFVFSRRGHLDVPMRDICDELGIEKRVRPHDLRRTHGSKVTGLGFGRDAMNRIQNHIEGGIADVYDRHEYADENQRIMEAVAQHIIDLAEGRRDTGNVTQFRAALRGQ